MPEPNIKISVRECPICKSTTSQILHELKFTLPFGSPLPSMYHILSCIRCGFVYADTPALQEDYDRFYSLNSKYEDDKVATGGFSKPDDISRLHETAKDLCQYLKISNRILDMGCANGGLLRILKNMGFNNLTGIDPSAKCVQKVKAAGIEAYEGCIFENELFAANEPNAKFDFIILSHVLEHIRDLETAIINCEHMLSDNGLIYIEVPNAAKYSSYYVVPYYYFDCEHINHFSNLSMNNLLYNFGMKPIFVRDKVLTVSKAKKYPALSMIYQRASFSTGNKFTKDTKTEKEILKYVEMSKADDRNTIIDKLFIKEEAFFIWGAGSYTLRLLSDTNLSKCKIIGIIDNDSNKRGTKLSGFTICLPEETNFRNFKIVICSALHSDEIIDQIRSMGIDNNIVVI